MATADGEEEEEHEEAEDDKEEAGDGMCELVEAGEESEGDGKKPNAVVMPVVATTLTPAKGDESGAGRCSSSDACNGCMPSDEANKQPAASAERVKRGRVLDYTTSCHSNNPARTLHQQQCETPMSWPKTRSRRGD